MLILLRENRVGIVPDRRRPLPLARFTEGRKVRLLIEVGSDPDGNFKPIVPECVKAEADLAVVDCLGTSRSSITIDSFWTLWRRGGESGRVLRGCDSRAKGLSIIGNFLCVRTSTGVKI
jgi:phosphomannomutase